MKDIMLADTPVEQRAQILRDSCDQLVERSYTRKFDQEEINERRADLANVAIQKADLEQSLAEIKMCIRDRASIPEAQNVEAMIASDRTCIDIKNEIVELDISES